MTWMLIGEAARDALENEEWFEWIGQAFGGPSGLGVSGVMLFVVFLTALGLFNWSESFKVPAVWLALMTPIVAGALPVPVVWRLIGIVVVGVAFLFVAFWVYWNRM